MALEALAARLGAEHGYIGGGGELLEYTVPKGPGMIGADAAGKALDRLVGVKLPSGAFYSARVNLRPNPSDEANYKSLNGKSEIPTSPYVNPAAFGSGLMRLADIVEAKQRVLSFTIRIGIPPRGFLAIHGDGLLAGPRVALVGSEVYQEQPGGSARRVTAHPRSWMRPPPPPKRHARSWLR